MLVATACALIGAAHGMQLSHVRSAGAVRLAPAAMPLAGARPGAALLGPHYRPLTPRRSVLLVALDGADELSSAAQVRLAQTVDELKSARRTLGSVLLLGALNAGFARAVSACGITFPPSLLGMSLIFGALCAARAHSAESADRATALLRPGVAWLTRWMPVFFAPALVSLPSALAPIPAADLLRLPFLIVGGYLLTVVSTALTLKAIPTPAAPSDAAPSEPPAPAPTRQFVVPLLAGAWATTGALLLPLCALGSVSPLCALVQAHCLALLWCAYASAERLPAKVRGVFHPTLLAGAGTFAALRLGAGLLATPAAAAAQPTLDALICAYAAKGGALAPLGGGGALLSLLPLTVLGFALSLYDQRTQLRASAKQIAAAAGVGALTGVVATALLARLVGLSAPLSRALLTRTITAPLAQLSAVALGAPPSLAVATTVLSGVLGANFGRKIIGALGVTDAAAMGLAMGTSAHGLGTAALSDWPEALAFSALALALNGLLIAAILVTPAGASLVRLLLGA